MRLLLHFSKSPAFYILKLPAGNNPTSELSLVSNRHLIKCCKVPRDELVNNLQFCIANYCISDKTVDSPVTK